jgi:hypothetical protein
MALKSKPLKEVRADVPVHEVMRGDLVRVNLNVPEATRTEWKMLALQRGMTLGDLIITAMSEYSKK